MPKPTFLNLPEDKRRIIITAALDEFGSSDYSAAVVGRIADRAGIAKGSIYQYFTGKKELYLYLLDLAAQEKQFFLTQTAGSLPADFFATLQQILLAGARFDLEQPRYSRLLYNAAQEHGHPEVGGMASRLRQHDRDFLQGLVAQAQANGQLKPDLDPELITLVASVVGTGIGDYLMAKHHISLQQLFQAGLGQLPCPVEELESVIDHSLAFLRRGLES